MTPSGALLAHLGHVRALADDEQAENAPTALRGKVSATLRTKDLLRLFPKTKDSWYK